MRPLFSPLVFFAALTALTLARADDSSPPRQRLLADFGWKFAKGDPPEAHQPAFDDSAWRRLDLPHDWSIEGPYAETEPSAGGGGYLPTGVGWYRREFVAPPAWRGRQARVEFDGVYMRSDVWLNGQHLGQRPFGYIGFEYDLTPHLKLGERNVLAVRVDNSRQPNSRWYSGSGIYRHVWLTVADPLRVAHWGVQAQTPQVSAEQASVLLRTQVQNGREAPQSVTLVSQIIDPAGQVVASAESAQSIAIYGTGMFEQSAEVPAPRRWSLDSPNLYRVRSLVKTGGQIVDQCETPFGIREIRYDTERGFLLNGQPVKLLGMCLHHEAGSVGAAVPEDVWERRLRLLKDMGCNAIRVSHNPAAPEFYDLCDRLGMLVMDEALDEWKSGKGGTMGAGPGARSQGYSTFFNEWVIQDLTDMLRRDRNHPSVVMWSVGNEIGEQRSASGAEILRPLVETCHREDPTRPVTAACDGIFEDRESAKLDFLNLLDIVGYNYVDRWGARRETYYADDRQKYPQRRFVGTEDVNIRQTRGEYRFRPMIAPVSERRPATPPPPENDGASRPAAPAAPTGPMRAEYATTMIRAEQLWKFVKTHDYVTGYFPWTGIDYLGEARWPRKSSTSGVLDTCGFPKDSYYFYQSQWTDKPTLHLFPHWNWPGREGQIIPVLCYTNCDVVELFLNGRSLGAKALEFPRQGTKGGWNTYAKPEINPGTADLHLAWDAPYEPGALRAVGYKDGKPVCEEEVRTAGAPAKLRLSVDRASLPADSRAVAHLAVRVTDAQGNLVPDASQAVTFEVSGAGRLIGADSGDPASHEDYKAATRRVFHGLALGLVQARAEPGSIRVRVHAEGLEDAVAEIEAKPSAEAMPLAP